ncbi:MAG: NAD-dependent epimerase/dehydratase family protein [Brevundimonas sp.]|uniref:NAD-dependent epimerase/dehydratase family protein n=1 Tax=Brevundimonas sp. TaxID=1871086 RepID=UPI00391AB4C0
MDDPPLPFPSGRLIVVGARGLIGSALVEAATTSGMQVVGVDRGMAVEDVVEEGDVVTNCALTPAYRIGPYDPAVDLERQTAEIARRRGARVLMLSTRKVYRDNVQWGAREDDPLQFDGAGYGPNKARTEAWIRAALGDSALIVRLSNIFGFEYEAGGGGRRSFFGQMLFRLKHEGEIVFDMSPATRRDFISVDETARALIGAVAAGAGGVFNLGSGRAVGCGEIADAVISGYGEGRLRSVGNVRDEFFLDISKWSSTFGCAVKPADSVDVAWEFGRRLRYA